MAMSFSSTLSNFFSFLSPTKQPPPPPPSQPPQLNLPPSPTPTPFPSSQTLKTKPSQTSVILSQQQHAPSSPSSCDELSSVICPSLAYANTLFFNSAHSMEVLVNEYESEEKLLDMFRREVMNPRPKASIRKQTQA